MCPAPEAISSNLKSTIERSFGSFENFKEQFTSTAKSLFGSGYVWLCEDDNGRLFILTSANQVHLILITIIFAVCDWMRKRVAIRTMIIMVNVVNTQPFSKAIKFDI